MNSKYLIFFITLALSQSVIATNEGTVSLGVDPLYAAATEVKIEGYAAYVLAISMYRAKHLGSPDIVESENLITGENFACREYSREKDKSFYICGGNYNYERKGELRPFDPDKFPKQ